MAVSPEKVRKQITFNKDLLAKAEKQADDEERTLSGLIAVLLKDYLNKVSERA
jgi:hypothetical protein